MWRAVNLVPFEAYRQPSKRCNENADLGLNFRSHNAEDTLLTLPVTNPTNSFTTRCFKQFPEVFDAGFREFAREIAILSGG